MTYKTFDGIRKAVGKVQCGLWVRFSVGLFLTQQRTISIHKSGHFLRSQMTISV